MRGGSPLFGMRALLRACQTTAECFGYHNDVVVLLELWGSIWCLAPASRYCCPVFLFPRVIKLYFNIQRCKTSRVFMQLRPDRITENVVSPTIWKQHTHIHTRAHTGVHTNTHAHIRGHTNTQTVCIWCLNLWHLAKVLWISLITPYK